MKRKLLLTVVILNVLTSLFCDSINTNAMQAVLMGSIIADSQKTASSETSNIKSEKTLEDLAYENSILADENEQLKKIIFESADITVNGEKIHTSGLLNGCALAWTKYKAIKNKAIRNGNYVEIQGEDIIQYKNNTDNIKNRLTVNTNIDSYRCSKCGKIHEQSFDCTKSNEYKLNENKINKRFTVIFITVIVIAILLVIILILINILLHQISCCKGRVTNCIENIGDIHSDTTCIKEQNARLSDSIQSKYKLLQEKFDKVYSDTTQIKRNVMFNSIINKNQNALIQQVKDNQTQESENESEQELVDSINSGYSIMLEDLGFSVRVTNCLKNSNIRTIDQLLSKSKDELTKTRQFGKKSLIEISEKLAAYGLKLKD